MSNIPWPLSAKRIVRGSPGSSARAASTQAPCTAGQLRAGGRFDRQAAHRAGRARRAQEGEGYAAEVAARAERADDDVGPGVQCGELLGGLQPDDRLVQQRVRLAAARAEAGAGL